MVRQDLAKNYQAVQAGHAVAEFMIQHPNLWRNSTLIYLRAKDEVELKIWIQRFADNSIPSAIFREPDIGDQITAIAAISNEDSDNMLKNMKLV